MTLAAHAELFLSRSTLRAATTVLVDAYLQRPNPHARPFGASFGKGHAFAAWYGSLKDEIRLGQEAFFEIGTILQAKPRKIFRPEPRSVAPTVKSHEASNFHGQSLATRGARTKDFRG
jgi:hypothetical protein